MYNVHYVRYSLQSANKAINKGGDPVSELKNMKLKLARVQKDLSQEQLAEAVGVTRQTIGLIEAGKYNPTIRLCIAICKVLGTTLDELFWEEQEG